jgi:hypothetical protein
VPKPSTPHQIPPEKFYSASGLAKEIGKTSRTVNYWIRDGRIKAIMVGAYYVIPPSEAERVKQLHRLKIPRRRRTGSAVAGENATAT